MDKQNNTSQQDQTQQQAQQQIKQSGIFRLKGIIAFAATVVVIGLIFVVYAGQIIKASIEQGGSWYWGAQVDVANVDVTWSPFKLSVQEFEATDPQTPANNLVAFEQANVSLDLWQALLGKTLVHELVITDVGLNKARKSPGWVSEKVLLEQAKQDETVVDQAAQSLPSVDELMARSELKTVKAGIKLKQTYDSEKVAIDELRKDLPTQAELKEYQAAVKRITDAKVETPEQLAKLKDDLALLKAKFEKDKVALSKAKKQLSQSSKKVATALSDLKDAPEQDMQMISERYQLNEGGAQNYAKLLFGPQAAEYTQLAQEYYAKAKPFLDKMNQAKGEPAKEVPLPEDGRFVHFEEQEPLPEWLVEKAQISMSLAQGQFDIQINELTAQHWVRNAPTTIKVTSENLLSTGALNLAGKLTVAKAGEVNADANWQVQGLNLVDLSLSDSEKFAMSLNKASMQLDGNINYQNDKFTNSNNIVLNGTEFSGKGDGKMSQLLVDVVSEVKNLSLDVGITGDANDQDTSIQSDLDSIIYQAMKSRMKVELDKFKGKAKVRLQEEVAEQLNLTQGDAAALKALDGDFSNIEKQLEELMKSKLEDKLKDTLKDKLLNKLGDFF